MNTMNRPLTFRSFCSGIGAPEVAWKRLGWHGLSTCELEPQPSAVNVMSWIGQRIQMVGGAT